MAILGIYTTISLLSHFPFWLEEWGRGGRGGGGGGNLTFTWSERLKVYNCSAEQTSKLLSAC